MQGLGVMGLQKSVRGQGSTYPPQNTCLALDL
jgi:hypothetical protein